MDITNDPKIAAVIEKVKKLLALAADERGNEHQAAAAAAKAQELLEAYNLDMATVGSGKSGAREDAKLKGGLYKWQRQLWEAVARQNFCMYWSHRGLAKGSTYQHQVIGSRANVMSTRLMAEYLEQAIERIAREEFAAGDPRQFFIKAAIAYREGMASRIIERLWQRRYRKEEEARQARREAINEQEKSGAPSRALTLLDVAERETDANMDYIHGEGWSARMRQRRADFDREYQAQRLQQQDFERRDRIANPEKWAKIDAEREREQRRQERNARRRKGRTWSEPKVRHESYYDGYSRGADVSLDEQVGGGKKTRQIGG